MSDMAHNTPDAARAAAILDPVVSPPPPSGAAVGAEEQQALDSKKLETIADIIREMHDLGALDEECDDMIPRSLQALGLRTYADRLEAARKRETGSAAAMREALSKCYQLAYEWEGNTERRDGASPTPWRVADIEHDHDILDADGKVAARAAHGNRELAALICDAVNLKTRIDEAMKDEAGFLHPVMLYGRPCVFVAPPPSEAEESRMHREYETSLLVDRERFRRCYYEAAERNDRLRDIVRRLHQMCSEDWARTNEAGRALLREAREAIGEAAP